MSDATKHQPEQQRPSTTGEHGGWYGERLRWMYRGKRPNWLAKRLNWLSVLIGASGALANYMETLEVIGRKSGRSILLPVVITVVEGQHYLVSMLGEDVQWVLNVRAANGKAYMHCGRRREVRLEEVAVAQRAPIIKRYLSRAPGGRPHISVDMHAPLAEFERIAADYPVFRIVDVR